MAIFIIPSGIAVLALILLQFPHQKRGISNFDI